MMDAKPHWIAYGEKCQITRDLIQGQIDVWCTIMGLDGWDLSADYCSTFPEEGMEGTTADCKVRWEYKHATIRLNLSELTDLESARLEKMVVHELCHILVAEMRDAWTSLGDAAQFDIKHEERVVVEMTSAFLRAKAGS